MINEGNVKRYCKGDISKIENYELAVADTTQMWDCHHRGEILPCGQFTRSDLKKFGLYYNRPANELIFLTKAQHRTLHKKGVPLSEEHKKALSEAHKGIPLSEEHKKALSEAHKGVPLSEENKKALSEATKGIPKSEAAKKAMSEARKGKKSWTNGIIEKLSKECPGPDFENVTLRRWRKIHGINNLSER